LTAAPTTNGTVGEAAVQSAAAMVPDRVDARFVRGSIAAWYAAGGARALKPTGG
jgi:hypothetical protein